MRVLPATAASDVLPDQLRRGGDRATDRRRLWALGLGLAAASAVVFLAVVVPLPPYDEEQLPWLFFVVAYAVAAVAALRVTVRGEAVSIAMVEVPLIIGFYYARPSDLVLSQLVGMAVVLALTRRTRLPDAVFALARATLATSLAFLVFLALAPPGLEEVLAWWLASFAGACTIVAVTVTADAAARSLVVGGVRPAVIALGLGLGLIAAVAGTSVALVAVAFIHNHPADLWLVLVPVILIGIGNLAYAAQRDRQAKVEFLYDCARTLQRSLVDADTLVELLARTRVMFRADVAEIALAAAGRAYPSQVMIWPDGEVETGSSGRAGLLADRLALLTPERQGVVHNRRVTDAALAGRMTAAGFGDVVIVPLRGAGEILGTLMVANRLPHRGSFSREDQRLLETLAVHAGAALENSGLVDRLADSLANVTQLAAAVESSEDAILALTPTGSISAWNPAAERLFGYAGSELAGRPALDLSPPEHRETATRAFGGMTAEDTQRRGMSEMLRKDGVRLPVSVTLSPILDRSGDLAGLSAIVHDETERTAADAALRESVERFRSVFRDGPIGMALTDGDLRWTAVNEALCQILERSEEELLGERFTEFVHPDEAVAAVRMVSELLATDTQPGYSAERRYVTGTGRVVWTRLTVRRLLDDASGDARMIVMIEDVTESRLAAQRVRDTEARLHRAVAAFTAVREPASVLRAVLAAARDLLEADFAAIAVLAEDGEAIAEFHVDGVSEGTASAIGQAPTGCGVLSIVDGATGATRMRDVRGHPAATGFPPGHPAITSFLAVPIVFEGRLVARLYAGNKRGAAEFDVDDEGVATALAAQAAVVLENARISARTLELVAELDRANADLRRANDAKSEFLGTVSHELRTPLHSILVAAELVHDPLFGPLTETRARELGATIQGSARHLLELIDDLVDLSRIEAHRIDIRPVDVHVARLLEEVCAEIAPIGQDRGVSLRQRCEPDLVIHADPLRIRQVLVNLLANAVKFSAEGGTARIEGRRTMGGVEISVHDTGPGIPHQDLTRIFEPFERLAGVRVPGAGLGLAIAQRLVDLHGGRLGVESEIGFGSTFTVVLPDGATSAGRAADGDPRGDAPPVTGRPGDTILVVEDDATALRLVSDVLERSGYAVWPAADLREATERLEEELPSLVLLDLRLGDEDGLDLVRMLRADPRTRRLPILALSADAMRHDVDRALAAGCDGHLAKPVDTRELLRRVGGLIPESATSAGGRGA